MCALRRHVAAQESFQEASEQGHQASAAASQNGTEPFSLQAESSTAQADATIPGLQVNPTVFCKFAIGKVDVPSITATCQRESASASQTRSSAQSTALHWLSM